MLSEIDGKEIKELSERKRREYNLGMDPLGENIFKLLRNLNINVLYYPSRQKTNQSNHIHAVFAATENEGIRNRFIMLNTNEYYDKQIFAVAHELYHFWVEESKMHTLRNIYDSSQKREMKANRFAAEFLLPTESLIKEISEKNNGFDSLKDWSKLKILRFTAQLHCDYKLPYKAIIKRLYEVKAIEDEQYNDLIQEDVRVISDTYHKIGVSIDKGVFDLLNEKTMKTGSDTLFIDMIISNYENGIISLDELANDLNLFGKSLEDFGLDEDIDEETLLEMEELIKELQNESE